MGFLGLITPLLIVINFIFLLFWILFKKYKGIGLSLACIILGWNVIWVCFGTNIFRKNNMMHDANHFTLMSYNVRLLDLYDWSGEKGNRIKMLEFFKKENPDILCLQEFYSKDNSGLDNINAIKTIGEYPYHAECNIHQFKNRKWGNVLFSKFPIVHQNNILINDVEKNLLQEVELDIKGKRIRVYNMHLHSNKLSSDLEWKDEKQLSEKAKQAIEKSKSIFNKLLKAYEQRGNETDISALLMDDEHKPKIVCGDMNDLPSSYTYFNIRSGLKDAFLEKGKGVGSTYSAGYSYLRIDYIFYDKKLSLNGFEKKEVKYSDHYPIISSFAVPN